MESIRQLNMSLEAVRFTRPYRTAGADLFPAGAPRSKTPRLARILSPARSKCRLVKNFVRIPNLRRLSNRRYFDSVFGTFCQRNTH
jgi:hypothetical protein